ncbi:MAG: hypothetical protein MPK62_00345 [Alphaproteobacteria bacterium]|nr:hypothetical protein [Alphaproteobacteria bacterium]MDA8029587.1 hypothetical protein [Alphaproteobacteria bacterium]
MVLPSNKKELVFFIGVAAVVFVIGAVFVNINSSDSEARNCLNYDGYDVLGPDGIDGTSDDHYFEPNTWAESCITVRADPLGLIPNVGSTACLSLDGYDKLGPDGIRGTDDDYYFEDGSEAEACLLDPARGAP